MNPSSLIIWALCIGVAWLIFVGLTGADEWLKSLFGKSKAVDLKNRLDQLEKRVADLEKR